LPRISQGYESIESFVRHAQSVLNRRKARAGKSLERHVARLLEEEGMVLNRDFSVQAVTEGKKTPDFLFPNAEAYRDPSFPSDRLVMLAAKTSLKDRWRQILNKANRIPTKHLITLQEGVTLPQFEEMQAEHVTLVVPASLHQKYPTGVREYLWTLERFFQLVGPTKPLNA
jgi:hypothetical protein